jgi:hypothetical protein
LEMKVLMMKIHTKCLLGAALMVAVFTAPASAGIITDPLSTPAGPAPVASGPGLGLVAVPVILTGTPNNDNVPAIGVLDNNIVVPLKRFDNPDYIDIIFTVAPSGAVTEYSVSESIDNNTGINWSAYRMQLGFGFGPGFTLSPAGDGLDFDFPTFDLPPTSTAMPIVVSSEDELLFTGGIHSAGLQLYDFRIDVPDLSTLPDFGSFTLRQIPVPVPEPSTVVLAGLTLVGLCWSRRRS